MELHSSDSCWWKSAIRRFQYRAHPWTARTPQRKCAVTLHQHTPPDNLLLLTMEGWHQRGNKASFQANLSVQLRSASVSFTLFWSQSRLPNLFRNTKSVWSPSDCHFQSESFRCLRRLWEEKTETGQLLMWIRAVSLTRAVKLEGSDGFSNQIMLNSHLCWSNAIKLEGFFFMCFALLFIYFYINKKCMTCSNHHFKKYTSLPSCQTWHKKIDICHVSVC